MGERLTLVDGTSTIKNPQLTEAELRGPPPPGPAVGGYLVGWRWEGQVRMAQRMI